MRRRRCLTLAGVAATAPAAGPLAGDGISAPSAGPDADSGDWFDGVDGFAFAPAAVVVSAGTAVTCRPTGRGGRHNVLARSGAFESQLHSAGGDSFDRSGLYPYYRVSHRSRDTKGAVRVRDD